jgi:hypothetical protein
MQRDEFGQTEWVQFLRPENRERFTALFEKYGKGWINDVELVFGNAAVSPIGYAIFGNRWKDVDLGLFDLLLEAGASLEVVCFVGTGSTKGPQAQPLELALHMSRYRMQEGWKECTTPDTMICIRTMAEKVPHLILKTASFLRNKSPIDYARKYLPEVVPHLLLLTRSDVCRKSVLFVLFGLPELRLLRPVVKIIAQLVWASRKDEVWERVVQIYVKQWFSKEDQESPKEEHQESPEEEHHQESPKKCTLQ